MTVVSDQEKGLGRASRLGLFFAPASVVQEDLKSAVWVLGAERMREGLRSEFWIR